MILDLTGIGLLGTGQYSQILDSIVIGGYFLLLWQQIQYQSDSNWHRPHASKRLCSSACDVYSDRHNHLSGHHADMLLLIKHNHCHHRRVLGFFVVIAMLYTGIGLSVLVLGIDIARGQYYWILDIGAFLGIVLTLFSFCLWLYFPGWRIHCGAAVSMSVP